MTVAVDPSEEGAGAQIVHAWQRRERDRQGQQRRNLSSAAPRLLLRPRPHDGERFPLRLHGGLGQLLGWSGAVRMRLGRGGGRRVVGGGGAVF